MIKRALKTYLPLILLIGAGYVITSCQREDDLFPQETGTPIQLYATLDWPEISKAPINNLGELTQNGDGVVIWANNNISQNVFGLNGTKATYQNNKWNYSPTRYWQDAQYTYAAVAPSSYFNASYPSSNDSQKATATLDPSTGNLNLNFGETGIDLSTSQVDLMYAFTSVNNLDGNNTGSVNINLNHMFAQINIQFTSDSPDKVFSIQSITIYGNHKYVKGNLTLSTTEASNIAALQGLQQGKSTETDFYKKYTRPSSNYDAWDILSTKTSSLVEQLIVFPEDLSVKVVYLQDGQNKERIINLTTTWQMGKVYTFLLSVDGIEIAEPVVTPWTDAEADPNLNITIQ